MSQLLPRAGDSNNGQAISRSFVGGIVTKYKKNHRTLYVDSDIWESIRVSAKSHGRSVSNYLVNLHNANLGCRDSAKPDDAIPIKKITSKEISKLLNAFKSGKALMRSSETSDLANEVTKQIGLRDLENIDEWSDRLAEDLSKATD